MIVVHQLHPQCILVVEDSPEITLILTRRLSQLLPAHQLLTAQSGKEALAYGAVHTIELAIIDYRLPGGMTGLDVMIALKAATPDLCTMLITASPSDALEAEAVAAGVDFFLVKPFLLPEFDKAVNSLMP